MKPANGMLYLFAGLAAALSSGTSALAGEPDAARQAELQALLDGECRACHSQAGEADPISSGMIGYSSDDYLSEAILEGIQKKGMPGWGDRLSLEDALWIVGRLRKDALN